MRYRREREHILAALLVRLGDEGAHGIGLERVDEASANVGEGHRARTAGGMTGDRGDKRAPSSGRNLERPSRCRSSACRAVC